MTETIEISRKEKPTDSASRIITKEDFSEQEISMLIKDTHAEVSVNGVFEALK
jgi:hypothetical protein